MGPPYNDAGQVVEVVDAGLNAAQQGLGTAANAVQQIGSVAQGIAAQFGSQNAQQIGAAQSRTITSGIARVQGIAQAAAPVLDEFEQLVAAMTGNPAGKSGLTGTGSTQSTGTAGAIHDAASLIESFVSRIGALVKVARGAHG